MVRRSGRIGGNPAIRVMASGGSHEVTAFFTCTQGTTKAVACGLGTAVTDDPDLKAKGRVMPWLAARALDGFVPCSPAPSR